MQKTAVRTTHRVPRMLTVLALLAGTFSFTAITQPGPAEASSASSTTDTPRTSGWQRWYAYVKAGEKVTAKMTFSRAPLHDQIGTAADQTVTLEGPGYAKRTCKIAEKAKAGDFCFGTAITAKKSGVFILTSDTPDGSQTGGSGAANFFSWTFKTNTASGAEIPGRVWADKLYRAAQATPVQDNLNTFLAYYLSDQGWAYTAQYKSYNGLYSNILASSQGIVSLKGTNKDMPYYGSLSQSTVDETNYSTIRASSNQTFKVFFEPPAADLPVTSVKGYAETAINVSNAAAPLKPTIQGLDCVLDATDNIGATCTWAQANNDASSYFQIDTNGNGSYNDTADIMVKAQRTDGTQTYVWNGKTANGGTVAPGTTVSFKASVNKMAEIHLTQTDVEYRGGLRLHLLNPVGLGLSDAERRTVYWNDTTLGTSGRKVTDLRDGRAGVNSIASAGVHNLPSTGDSGDNGWGNSRIINDWAFVPTAVSDTTALALPIPPVPTLTKSVSLPTGSTEAHRGDRLHYKVTLTQPSNGGVLPAAHISDDLTEVLDDGTLDVASVKATYPDTDATTVDLDAGPVTQNGNILSWDGALNPGQSVVLDYYVDINATATGDSDMTNVAVGCEDGSVSCTPPPATCAAGDDLCASTSTAVSGEPALTVSKVSAIDGNRPGSTLTYTVTATNSGDADYDAANPAVVIDDLGRLLDDATYNGDADSTTGTFDYTKPRLTWTGPLAAGESIDFTYTATVNDPLKGDNQIDNTVIDGTDPEEVPPPGDGFDCADVTVSCDETRDTVLIPHLTVQKNSKVVLDGTPHIDYTVVATNDGELDFDTTTYPARMEDEFSRFLDDATFNDDVVADRPGELTYAKPRLTWTGGLAIDDSVTFTYSADLKDKSDRGNSILDNVVVALPDATSTPVPGGFFTCADTTLACDATTDALPKSQLKITKTAKATGESAGDTITYTVKATNAGTTAFTVNSPALVVDDLTKVLDDAKYNKDAKADAKGILSFKSPRIQWTGALAPGKSVTLTYTVTAFKPLKGDNTAFNVAVATDDPKAIPAKPFLCKDTKIACAETVNRFTGPKIQTLPFTGGAPFWLLLAGLGALGTGGAIMLGKRKTA